MTDTTISTADVTYVARLACIAVNDDEARTLAAELTTILGYVRKLESLDTRGVKPTYQVTGLQNVDRDDVIIDYSVIAQTMLALAPHIQDNQIKVPKVL